MLSLRQTVPILLPLLCLLLSGTTEAQVSVTGALTRTFDVQPGSIIEDTLELRNPSPLDAQVRIYQTDYTFHATGESAYPEPGSLPRSNALWLELGAQTVTVPAGGTTTVPYRALVPESANLGSHWSLIMVEEVKPQPAAGGTLTLQTVMRYGVQIITNLGSADSELVFTSADLSPTETGSLLTVDVINTGELSLLADHYVELYDANGSLLIRTDGERSRTHPGTGVRQEFELGELTPGTYQALVVADGGGANLFGAQFTLRIE